MFPYPEHKSTVKWDNADNFSQIDDFIFDLFVITVINTSHNS